MRGPARRERLNRDRVVALALGVLDDASPAEGDPLTLASVAAVAGVAPPSLYKHVGSIAELRNLVAAACVDEVNRALARATLGRARDEAVRAAADALRGYARSHPARYLAMQFSPGVEGPGASAVVAAAEETIGILTGCVRGFGIPDDRLIDAIRMLRSGLHGFVHLEVGGGFRRPEDVEASFAVLVDVLVRGLEALADPARLPEASSRR